ncbi:hypothetical protein M0R04_06530 [Candidatus Dojkabacteria bacterium]|jgi:hypothetical protein|nr:hypothetical protein [Candidatus Dojkabacteria bacterium]
MATEDGEVDEYYKRQAREYVDLLFDKGFLDENLSREAIRWLEDYSAYILQSAVRSSIKAHDLVRSLREKEVKKL